MKSNKARHSTHCQRRRESENYAETERERERERKGEKKVGEEKRIRLVEMVYGKGKKKSQESRYKIVQRIIIIINSNRSFVIRNTTQRMVQRSRELILNGL